MRNCILLVFLTLLTSQLFAAPITYYDLDFEDGTLGGGNPFVGFSLPTNESVSNLDGRALQFNVDSQLDWSLNGPDSLFHYVAFDFFAESGANVTQFLDVPSILRSDISVIGRHRFEALYDFNTQTIATYLDGILDNSLNSISIWPIAPSSSSVRIANQAVLPGASTGIFQIDNLLWMGDDTAFRVNPVSAPSVVLLMAVIGGLVMRLSRKN